MLGARLKEWSSYQCWARLVAASGMIAVVATNRDPARDARALLSHLRTRGRELGIDPERIGLWACSGNAPNALSLLLDPAPVPRCAALCYGYLLDDEGSTAVVDAARGFFFVAPAAGRPIAALPVEVPLLVVRAGRDETPGLNAVLDRFVARALALDLPIALVNHSGAPHAFDLEQDGETAGPVIRQVLDFLRTRLERARS
jgi:acetyl esterase/lipase